MNFREHFETAWNSTLKYIAPRIIMTLAMLIVSIHPALCHYLSPYGL